jgi:hypothetical protein
MVAFREDGVFPVPRGLLWKLLEAHQDDAKIPTIHPLVLAQTTIERGVPESLVDRTIDVRGRPLRSRWKLTYRPPDLSRWEVVESEGPWAVGSFLENAYSEDPAGTRIVTRGDLRILGLSFFLPQGFVARRILRDIDDQDLAYLSRIRLNQFR